MREVLPAVPVLNEFLSNPHPGVQVFSHYVPTYSLCLLRAPLMLCNSQLPHQRLGLGRR
jgi:hypothetical protein